jgi:1D-myo-inositol-triphosphate 3-kinase
VVQAAGHANSVAEESGEQGSILKIFDQAEADNYSEIWNGDQPEPLQEFIPQFGGIVPVQVGTEDSHETQEFLRIENLLTGFVNPHIMDCKMGVRTFTEAEAKNTKPREDLYQKLIKTDPDAATPDEHKAGAITKTRYLMTRDSITTTTKDGFRIDGIVSQASGKRVSSGVLKEVREKEQLLNIIPYVLPPNTESWAYLIRQTLDQLDYLGEVLDASPFFKSHELIGCSLLFIFDHAKAGVFLIDLAKTSPLGDGVVIDHRSPWSPGNHEDGFLIGIRSIRDVWTRVLKCVEDDKIGTSLRDPQHEEASKKLVDLCTKHGVDTKQFGVDGAKSLDDLYFEIHVENAVTLELNAEGVLCRMMDVLKTWIMVTFDSAEKVVLMQPAKHATGHVYTLSDMTQFHATLKEQSRQSRRCKSEPPNGTCQIRTKPVQAKIRSGETWQDTLERAFSKLGIEPDFWERHFDVKLDTYTVASESVLGTHDIGFPGLNTHYRVHQVDVHIRDMSHPDLAKFGLPDGVPFKTVFRGDQSNPGLHQAVWLWQPLVTTSWCDRSTDFEDIAWRRDSAINHEDSSVPRLKSASPA